MDRFEEKLQNNLHLWTPLKIATVYRSTKSWSCLLIRFCFETNFGFVCISDNGDQNLEQYNVS